MQDVQVISNRLLSRIIQNQHVSHVQTQPGNDVEEERPKPFTPLDAMGEPNDLGPVFHQFNKDTISHRFKRISRECGTKDVHFHNLHHSATTQMIESGVIGDVAQRILGHSDYSTTQIYVNLSQSTLAEEMKKLKY